MIVMAENQIDEFLKDENLDDKITAQQLEIEKEVYFNYYFTLTINIFIVGELKKFSNFLANNKNLKVAFKFQKKRFPRVPIRILLLINIKIYP